ncbi:MAG: ferritin family protein [Candidatus Glassbacteria bacterium]
MSQPVREKEDLIKLAIEREIRAYDFFNDAVDRMSYKGTKEMLRALAMEEQRHREMLERALKEEVVEHIGTDPSPMDFKIGDALLVPELTQESTPQDLMIVAMKLEEASVAFYQAILPHFRGSGFEDLISRLVREEQKHKERLEKEYDDHFLSEM